ncbi:MAG: HIT family protein [Chloroflexi bacterium]|jgi:histidine triad (HIT) family protein|nr:HIT family protein [Chloroflexota bacterium]
MTNLAEHQPDCPFCAIASGALGCHKVYADASVTAFMDKNPINPYHLLVIPNVHVADFYELDDATYVAVMRVVKKMAAIVKSLAAPQKVGLVVAGFDVPHAHIHVIPMHDYHDITSRHYIEGTLVRPDDAELARNAAEIKSALGMS